MKVVLLEVSLINFIPGISKEIEWKVKVVFLEVSLMNFILRRSMQDQMEDESDVNRRIIDQIHSSDIPGGQMESERGVSRSIIDELHS